jgi:hypothetical protein
MARNNIVFVQIRASTVTSGTTTSTEIDMGPYINVGGREVIGVWAPGRDSTCTSDASFANKFQESATTVDSDFGDITGGGFTTVTDNTFSLAFDVIEFPVTKRYLRSYITLTGGTAACLDYTGVILTARADT